MQFFSNIQIKDLEPSITYRHKVMLTGSCFSEHIGNFLATHKFNILQNPNGILFDPISVCNSLVSYTQNKHYTANDLFYLNDTWHSWQHHSVFSNMDQSVSLNAINRSQDAAYTFLSSADWLIITLGSAFSYRLSTEALQTGIPSTPVANCHKAPAQYFTKHLCTIEEIVTALDGTIHRLFHFNKKLRIIFTISPVRHLRDGVVDNNRSKARLIEAVHHVVNKFDRLYYFPSYELVIDVLRDYRFFDIDLAHPNYAATQFVLEKFTEHCFDASTRELLVDIKKIVIAASHKPFNPTSQQHQKFLQQHAVKTEALQDKYPFLDFSKELKYFREN